MGSAESTPIHVFLLHDFQLALKGRPLKEAIEVVERWFEEGAPLGLVPLMFDRLFQLSPDDSRSLFGAFDTDKNQKIDAFEALSAAIILAQGTLDAKVKEILPIFDFSSTGLFNFDEANIMVHSVHRGLQKLFGFPEAEEEDIMDVCKLMFDSFNLHYEKQISSAQIQRWLKSDDDVSGFLNAFHCCKLLLDVERELSRREQLHAQLFTQLCDDQGLIPTSTLINHAAFREALGNPSVEAVQDLVHTMASENFVSLGVFARVVHAWSVFDLMDGNGCAQISTAEIRNILLLQLRNQPTDNELRHWRKALDLDNPDSVITRSKWVGASLS